MAKKPSTEDRKENANLSKMARRKNRGNLNGTNVECEYESLDHTGVVRLIDAVSNYGGTITFGTTKDGGAYFISIFCDSESQRFYIRPTENPDEWIANEIQFWLD